MLAIAALLALLVSNSPWSHWYEQLLQVPGELRIGGNWLVLSKPLLVWINDLWMAVFFFLVGLEIKRELLEGNCLQLVKPFCQLVLLWAVWLFQRSFIQLLTGVIQQL